MKTQLQAATDDVALTTKRVKFFAKFYTAAATLCLAIAVALVALAAKESGLSSAGWGWLVYVLGASTYLLILESVSTFQDYRNRTANPDHYIYMTLSEYPDDEPTR